IKLAAADVKMPLTREELESRIEELIAATADLLEDALAEAGVAREELVGLLMAGGVAQTPLVGLTLRRRFDIAPMLAAPGARVLVKDAPPAVTRELPVVEDEEPVRRRGPARAAVVGAALLVVVAAGAAFGSQLGDGDVPDDGAGAAESAATTEADSAPTSKTASPEATDTPSGDGASASSESPSEEQDEAQVEPTREAQPSDEERPPTESAATGTVPNLVGLSTADARKAVDGAGFDGFDQNGRERGFFELYDDCEVIEQDPAPGSTRPLSATVAVTFSYSGDESECDS
ncbi:MAG TPA: PASTA domain-containing protein, partial [Glycomyces sp.]|nr:PASTA domain-containing protein [Glycomyces sp.]